MSTLSQILSVIVLFQLFFIGFFLFTSKKGNRLSNYLLAFFFLSLGFGLLDYVLLLSGFFDQHRQFAFLLNGLVIFHAPLLLLYTQSLTATDFNIKPIQLLHSLPYFVSMGLLGVFYYTQSEEIQEMALAEVKSGEHLSAILITAFGLVYEFAYLAAVKIRIRNYRTRIKEQFSNLDKINLNWLNFLVNIFILSFLASTAGNVVRHSPFLAHLEDAAMLVALFGLFFFINSVLLKGLHQNEIFLGSQPRTLTSSVDQGEQEAMVEKLNQHLEIAQPFLSPDLTLNELADQLEIPARQLSNLINQQLGQTFFDLINRYRVEEAKRRIRESDDPKLTVLEVMYQVGFNSKSSFNTAFKKYTGQTPTEFRSLAS